MSLYFLVCGFIYYLNLCRYLCVFHFYLLKVLDPWNACCLLPNPLKMFVLFLASEQQKGGYYFDSFFPSIFIALCYRIPSFIHFNFNSAVCYFNFILNKLIHFLNVLLFCCFLLLSFFSSSFYSSFFYFISKVP